jgi:hypothetical protein
LRSIPRKHFEQSHKKKKGVSPGRSLARTYFNKISSQVSVTVRESCLIWLISKRNTYVNTESMKMKVLSNYEKWEAKRGKGSD